MGMVTNYEVIGHGLNFHVPPWAEYLQTNGQDRHSERT